MSIKFLKNTAAEAVVKITCNQTAGETIDLPLSSLAQQNEGFTAEEAQVNIAGIYWGINKDKVCNMQRYDTVNTVYNSDIYFHANGSLTFQGFADNANNDGDLRFIFDGEGSVIIILRKASGYRHWSEEDARYGVYNDPTQEGPLQ